MAFFNGLVQAFYITQVLKNLSMDLQPVSGYEVPIRKYVIACIGQILLFQAAGGRRIFPPAIDGPEVSNDSNLCKFVTIIIKLFLILFLASNTCL